MTREPASDAELHAAEHECAESSVALYAARKAWKAARKTWKARWSRETEDALTAAENAYAAAKLRHRNATAAWLAIRPEEPK